MSYRVAVRTLCEFTAKSGDLDLRFTPSPTAQEGIAGHRRVVKGRGPDYEAEVALEGVFGELEVRGRADGYTPGRNCLEEIKTHRGDLDTQPDNHRQLHWAQAKVYGWLMCQQRDLPSINLALVYLDVDSDRETRFECSASAAELERYFQQLCQRFVRWAEQQGQRLALRDAGAQRFALSLAVIPSGPA